MASNCPLTRNRDTMSVYRFRVELLLLIFLNNSELNKILISELQTDSFLDKNCSWHSLSNIRPPLIRCLTTAAGTLWFQHIESVSYY